MWLHKEFQGQVPLWQWMTGGMAKRAAKDMFPVNSCRGHMSTPHASGGQTCRAALQAIRKDWWSLPSSSIASLSISCIHSPCDCCRMQACSAQVVSASLIGDVHIVSASQIMVTQWAFTSLIALAVWPHFDGKQSQKSNTCFLWQASMDALVISRCPMALFISSCSWSTSLERALRSVPGQVPGCGAAGTLVGLGVSDARVEEGKCLIGMASSGLAAKQCLLWSSYWLGHGWSWPVLSKWVLLSVGVTGCWYWSPQGAVPWGWDGGVQYCPRQELLKLVGHAGVGSHFTRTSTARHGRRVVLRLCRDLDRKASRHSALPVGGPLEVVKTHGQVCWGYSYPTWVVVGWRAPLALVLYNIILPINWPTNKMVLSLRMW